MAALPSRRRRRASFRRYPQFTISPAILVALLAGWWLATDVLRCTDLCGATARAGVARAGARPEPRAVGYGRLLVSQRSNGLGGAARASPSAQLLGALLGFVISHWPILGRSWYPYIVGFQSLPKVALAPLMVVWFGFGLARQGVHHRGHHLLPGAGEHDGGISGGRARAHRAGALLQRQRMAFAVEDHLCRAACRSCLPGLASHRCCRSSARWSASSSAPAPGSACC